MTSADDTLHTRRAPDLGRFTSLAVLIGAGALIVGLIFASMVGPGLKEFWHAYLVGFLFLTGLSVGCLAMGLLNNVVGGRWGEVIRPTLVIGAKSLPLLLIAFIPLMAFGLRSNYPWAQEYRYLSVENGGVGVDEVLVHQRPWQQPWFFAVRGVIYFAAWIGMSFALNAWNGRRKDEPFLPVESTFKRNFSGPGLVLLGVTATFAAIDWFMSLEPRWYSSVIGLSFIVGCGLSALAAGVLVLCLVTAHTGRIHKHGEAPTLGDPKSLHDPAHGPAVQPGDFGDLGNLLLAFTMLWAYLNISQLLIIWSGNLPMEVQFYKSRLDTGWVFVGLALLLFHFGVPFFMLLSQNIKRSGSTLAWLAGFILLMRLVDWIWLVEPSVHYQFYNEATRQWTTHLFGGWILPAVLVPVGMCLLWSAFFMWQLSKQVVLPRPAPAEPGHAHASHPPHATAAGHGLRPAPAAGATGGQHG